MTTTFQALTGAQAESVGLAGSISAADSLQPLFFMLAYPGSLSNDYNTYTGFGVTYTNETTNLGDIVSVAGTGNTLASAIAATTFIPEQASFLNTGTSSYRTITISGPTSIVSVPSTGASVGMSGPQQAALSTLLGHNVTALYLVSPVYENTWTGSSSGSSSNSYDAVSATGVAGVYDVVQNSGFGSGGQVYFAEYGEALAPSYIQVGQIGQGYAVPLPCVPCCNICGIVC